VLRLAVVVTVLIGDEDRWRGEELCLLEGHHVREVQVAPQASESPRRRIVHVCGQLRHVVGVESEAETSGTEISVERPVGARTRTPRKPDEPRRGAMASQRGAPEKKRRAGEVARGSFCGG
jgi:hypothetical protein